MISVSDDIKQRRRSMPSQLELLKEQLAKSEARSGSDNPFVQGLKAQIAMYEKPRAENPVDNRETYSVGMRGNNTDGT
jgi:hypothetical protein